MKILMTLTTLIILFFTSSCLHTMPRKVFDGEKPQICVDVFDKSPSYYEDANKLKGYTVEDLITLNKCGKEYLPEINLNLEIANHRTYPIPVLLEKLNQEESDEFRYDLIETLAYVSEYESGIYKYNDQFKKDKKIIISGVSEAIAKMKDGEYKKMPPKSYF